MKKLLLIVCCCALVMGTASAAGTEDALAAQRDTLELDELDRAAQKYLDETDLSLDQSWEENLDALIDTGTAQLFGVVKRAVRSGVLLLVIALLCAIGDGISLSVGETELMAVSLAGTLAVTAVAVTDVHSLMGMGTGAINSLTSFSNVLLPIVAGVTAATGAITGAAARQMAAALFSDLLVNLINALLIPAVYGFIAANVAYAAVGNEGLKQVAAFLKWFVVTVLTIILLVFVGYLTVSGIAAGSADAAAVKAAKFAISGAVPVVGSILADASESILAAAGILRSTVGIFGMLVILGICLLPFLQLAVHYLVYKLVSALAATVSGGRVSGLIGSLSGAFGLVLGMTGACALLLLVVLLSCALLVTA